MTNTTTANLTKEQVLALTEEQIVTVYSGKAGKCFCGCSGNYRVNPAHFELAGKRRGYAYDASEANLTQVRKVLRIVKENIDRVEFFNGGASVEIGERVYALYTVDSTPEVAQ
jgi:hypothetical protein